VVIDGAVGSTDTAKAALGVLERSAVSVAVAVSAWTPSAKSVS